MARGQNASTGRTARSEVSNPGQATAYASKAYSKLEKSLVGLSIFTDRGKLDPDGILASVESIRFNTNEESNGLPFKDFMADIRKELGEFGQQAAAGVITDAIELSYLRNARYARLVDIEKGGEESPRAVEAQYDNRIKDAETSIKNGLAEIASMRGGKGKVWADEVLSQVRDLREYTKSLSGGVDGKEVSKYDTKSVKKMLNDAYEILVAKPYEEGDFPIRIKGKNT